MTLLMVAPRVFAWAFEQTVLGDGVKHHDFEHQVTRSSNMDKYRINHRDMILKCPFLGLCSDLLRIHL